MKNLIKNGVKILSRNKKIPYEFLILKEWQAGMSLDGYDVKLLRLGRSVVGSYGIFIKNRIFIKGLVEDTVPLLMHKKEFLKIMTLQKSNRGSSLQILDLHTVKGLFKITLALCTYKKERDRREEIKKRDLRRSLSYN